ncbi:hypothetical protein RRSWK_00809 [Rhodopirellula sp. SWK7]|nr:hypothetical protein RRSWK_00809 [Rhodopirellula sp. SWK7]
MREPKIFRQTEVGEQRHAYRYPDPVHTEIHVAPDNVLVYAMSRERFSK